jgi:hypothetical protein
MSATLSTIRRAIAFGSLRKYARPCFRTAEPHMTVLNVNIESGLSPEKTFDRETPPSTRSPFPSDWRSSIAAASRGRFEVRILPVSLSYQPNAGMSLLLPWRIPAWLAPV